jgi:hypothetical protein
MGKTLRTRIDIAASRDRVWDVFTDFAAYPRWNPFIREIRGELRPGSRLQVSLAPPGRRAITLRPKVLVVTPGRELRWIGHLLVPGIFDGEHHFLIEGGDDAGVTFVQEEIFKGALIPFTRRVLARTRDGFEQMNLALKDRAEAGTTPPGRKPP